jgi:hypothetical protein
LWQIFNIIILILKMLTKCGSIPHEYYFGDPPGRLQYKKEINELINLTIPDNIDEKYGFELCEHSAENLKRTIPHTQRNGDWKIILMMQKNVDGIIWLKSALLNKNTGKVALLTSTNNKTNLERTNGRSVKTLDGEWVVGHYRMSAPVAFWRELQNRLLYSI